MSKIESTNHVPQDDEILVHTSKKYVAPMSPDTLSLTEGGV